MHISTFKNNDQLDVPLNYISPVQYLDCLSGNKPISFSKEILQIHNNKTIRVSGQIGGRSQ